jgi:hypothetical protein
MFPSRALQIFFTVFEEIVTTTMTFRARYGHEGVTEMQQKGTFPDHERIFILSILGIGTVR